MGGIAADAVIGVDGENEVERVLGIAITPFHSIPRRVSALLLSPVPSIDNCDAINMSIVSSESDDIVDDDDMDESSSTPLEEMEEADAREETL
eukprot:scaffold5428_cov158-Alexandrium_tamarense.AAC.2